MGATSEGSVEHSGHVLAFNITSKSVPGSGTCSLGNLSFATATISRESLWMLPSGRWLEWVASVRSREEPQRVLWSESEDKFVVMGTGQDLICQMCTPYLLLGDAILRMCRLPCISSISRMPNTYRIRERPVKYAVISTTPERFSFRSLFKIGVRVHHSQNSTE